MPRLEPEIADRLPADDLARLILDLLPGVKASSVATALGYVTARMYATLPETYHDRLQRNFGHGFEQGIK